MNQVVYFLKSEDGGSAIEYTFLASLIAMAAVAAMGSVGTNLSDKISEIAVALS
ncbi:MAG: pilus assembly protein Flp/PilA [Hyphomicrobiaceae bacterium]|jgi:pilus assembly protein Flp/PilA